MLIIELLLIVWMLLATAHDCIRSIPVGFLDQVIILELYYNILYDYIMSDMDHEV